MDSPEPTRAEKLAALILADQERLDAREREQRRERAQGLEFDPFSVRRWKVVAGGDPGFLTTTPMRKGPNGFFIACRGCGNKFESMGLAYCGTCMDLPAEERHALKPPGRPCAAPGCDKVMAPSARADAQFCSAACRQRARRHSRDKTGDMAPDIAPPLNVTATHEITQQNQRPKSEAEKSEVFDRARGDRVLSRWEPCANPDPTGAGWEIPDFLLR